MKKIPGLALFALISFNGIAQTADEIVKKHIDAIGGTANWAKVKSMKLQSKMKAQGAEVLVDITQVDKKAMRTDIAVMGMKGYFIVTNTEGWSFMPFQGQTKPEAMTADDVKKAQDELYIQEDFITYKELGKKLEYLGKDDVDGTECFKLKMTNKDGIEKTYFLDASDYYTVKVVEKYKSDGKELEGTTSYGNYKKLEEGIVYPMSISGGQMGDSEIISVSINPKIEESLFKVQN